MVIESNQSHNNVASKILKRSSALIISIQPPPPPHQREHFQQVRARVLFRKPAAVPIYTRDGVTCPVQFQCRHNGTAVIDCSGDKNWCDCEESNGWCGLAGAALLPRRAVTLVVYSVRRCRRPQIYKVLWVNSLTLLSTTRQRSGPIRCRSIWAVCWATADCRRSLLFAETYFIAVLYPVAASAET